MTYRSRYYWYEEGCSCSPTVHGNRKHTWRCKVHGGWKTIDWSYLLAGAIVFGVIALIVGGIIFIRVKAPCSVLDWMPVTDVPTRCLVGNGPSR